MFKIVKRYLPKVLTNAIYKFLHFYRTILLKGNNYLCTICKFKASKFYLTVKTTKLLKNLILLVWGIVKMRYVLTALVKIERD